VRRLHADCILSLGAGGAAHRAARLARSGTPWIRDVRADPGVRPANRWARVLDPRARALRAADAVTAPPAVAQRLHRDVAATAVPAADPAGDVAAIAAALARGSARAATRLLVLGTVNSPHVEHIALEMAARGMRVHVAGERAPAYPPSVLPRHGIPVSALELPAIPWLYRLLRRLRPDVVHANWLPAFAHLAALLRARPLVAMAWGSDVYGAGPRELKRCRYALARADVAMADSADLLERVVELGAPSARTRLLNWGVDLDRFAPPPDRAEVRRALGVGEGPLVLSPRALEPLYNPRVIVDAFERARSGNGAAQLLLKHIGTGEPDVGRPLPDGVRVVGHVPYDAMADYYRAADVCVSIPDSDSSPRSVWEAMASGCACVLSDLPWVHELIVDGEHALVVPPRPDDVAAAIGRLLADAALRERLGRAARELVLRHRDRRAEMDRLAALYEALAARRPLPH
jgi:glycosyltransferase involved in cell wall biosynthesis